MRYEKPTLSILEWDTLPIVTISSESEGDGPSMDNGLFGE